jgi:hypothetical protein
MASTLGTAETVLSAYRAHDDGEMADLDRLAAILNHSADPWSRELPMLHVVIVPVPARGDEPAHKHADLRFVLMDCDAAVHKAGESRRPAEVTVLARRHPSDRRGINGKTHFGQGGQTDFVSPLRRDQCPCRRKITLNILKMSGRSGRTFTFEIRSRRHLGGCR